MKNFSPSLLLLFLCALPFARAEDFPPGPPPGGGPHGMHGEGMGGPPPFMNGDDLLKKAFESKDHAVKDFVFQQMKKGGPEAMKDPAFRAELNAKLAGPVTVVASAPAASPTVKVEAQVTCNDSAAVAPKNFANLSANNLATLALLSRQARQEKIRTAKEKSAARHAIMKKLEDEQDAALAKIEKMRCPSSNEMSNPLKPKKEAPPGGDMAGGGDRPGMPPGMPFAAHPPLKMGEEKDFPPPSHEKELAEFPMDEKLKAEVSDYRTELAAELSEAQASKREACMAMNKTQSRPQNPPGGMGNGNGNGMIGDFSQIRSFGASSPGVNGLTNLPSMNASSSFPAMNRAAPTYFSGSSMGFMSSPLQFH